VILTFLDSSVLIAAYRGVGAIRLRAMEVLDDPTRAFARLELLPKARYYGRTDEVNFYEAFFAAVSDWAEPPDQLVRDALAEASQTGLAAMDALHVAAAAALGAAELLTAEAITKPIHRTRLVAVRSIRT